MSIVRIHRAIGGKKVLFVVNLTTHSVMGLEIPAALGREPFDVVVNEGFNSLPPMEIWPADFKTVKAQSYSWPEHELLHGLISLGKSGESLNSRLRSFLTQAEIEQFRELNKLNLVLEGKSAANKSTRLYEALSAKGWFNVLMDEMRSKEMRASVSATALYAAGGAPLLSLVHMLSRKQKPITRRNFIGRSLLALGFFAGARGLPAVSPARQTSISRHGTANESNVEFLKARIEAMLFPTLKITGRDAVIADCAIKSAYELAGKKQKTGEIKILINAGARHSGIVNMLKNDGLRAKNLKWYTDEIKGRLNSAFRQALKEEAKEIKNYSKKQKEARLPAESKLARRDFFRTIFGKRAEIRRRA